VKNAPTHTAPFDWRDQYLQALFETDRARLASRIAAAEWALFQRERELFFASDGKAEREAVNNALHALAALRMCLGLVNPRMAA
jgi:hypothetical protein